MTPAAESFLNLAFEAGFHVNMEGPKAAVQDGSVFGGSLTDTVIWSASSMAISRGNCKASLVPQSTSSRLGEKYQVTPTAIALAWVLRYPVHAASNDQTPAYP